MDQDTQQTKKCQICGSADEHLLYRARTVRSNIAETIKKQVGDWDEEGWICAKDLEEYRLAYVEELLTIEREGLGELEKDVIESLGSNEIISRDIGDEAESQYTFGERLADKIADFGGSWPFIIIFGAIIHKNDFK